MSGQQAPKVLVGCEECGLVTELPVLTGGQKASCPGVVIRWQNILASLSSGRCLMASPV